MAQTFTGTGWTAETTEPREASSVVSPHGDVRVYLNDEAVTAQTGAGEYPLNAMAVKELYDGTTVVGYAVMLKSTEGPGTNTWTYWCYGPAGRCSTGSEEATVEAPIYGTPDSNCGACHGGTIFTMIQ
jgi:hypothetical protein